MATDAIEAIQDMGAAGLTSSSVEMAGKGGVGVELDLDRVPQRETGMTAYEMMLSESQERMLMILKPGREAEAEAIFRKWELDFAVIGETTETGRLVLKHRGETVCDIPVAPLSEDAPCYSRPYAPAPKPAPLRAEDVPEPEDYGAALLTLMASPDIASKRWIWEQYDRHVMADTVDSSQSGGDAAIVRIHKTNRALAITCDVTPRYCAADAYEGGKQAVAEAYRNLCAVGATPIAITDCLNFGNPERPEVMAELVGCIEGMAEAARVLAMPIVSGNVSLYNETNGAPIPPTPAVGAVGLIEDLARKAVIGGMEDEDTLLLVGDTSGQLGQSLYLREIHGREDGAPPTVDLEAERRNGAFVRSLIEAGLVTAAHDVSDGGLLVAAAEMALASGVGVVLDASPSLLGLPQEAPPASPRSPAAFLFGEDGARFILAVRPRLLDDVVERARAASVPLFMLGQARGGAVAILGGEPRPAVSVALADLRTAHEDWLPRFMRGE
jgi:phosphoribosylformylglycinamidine synthase